MTRDEAIRQAMLNAADLEPGEGGCIIACTGHCGREDPTAEEQATCQECERLVIPGAGRA